MSSANEFDKALSFEDDKVNYDALRKRLDDQQKQFGKRWILISDIDGTAIHENVSSGKMVERVNEGLWGCVYNTGRSIDKVVEFVREGRLAVPQIVATIMARSGII